MWHSFYSTGIERLDADHDNIDSLLGELSEVAGPKEEQEHLMKVYCAIIDHIRYKFDLLGPQLTKEEKDRDADFLGTVRQKIRERNQGLISRKELIADLQNRLRRHAMDHLKCSTAHQAKTE